MSADAPAGTPMPQLWTREGLAGPMSVVTRKTYGPDFLHAEGVHVPRRAVLERLLPRDATDNGALPTIVATSRLGVRLSTSARRTAMPFVVRNVEADELHFIQAGTVRFDTDVGSLLAEAGDFVCIPRSVAYRYAPTTGAMRSLIVESPTALALTPPSPMGMINFARDVQAARVDAEIPAGGPTRLLLKTFEDEPTSFLMAHDPLALGAQLGEKSPVWKLNLAKLQSHTYEPHGGPPSAFLSSRRGDVLMFNMSSRSGGRPPVHVNADFDELILYVGGPGAWGACDEPGTLTWVPKGVIHHGPREAVPEGYRAWLLETRATLRFTPEAVAASQLMETGEYGPHPGATA